MNGLDAMKATAARPIGESEPPPLLPPCDDERHEQEHARILEAHREPCGQAGELEPARHQQRERDRDAERQRYVGHRGS